MKDAVEKQNALKATVTLLPKSKKMHQSKSAYVTKMYKVLNKTTP